MSGPSSAGIDDRASTGGTPCLLGEAFTVADSSWFTLLNSTLLGMSVARCPALVGWYDKLAECLAVRASRGVEGVLE